MASDQEVLKLLVDSWEELRLALKQQYIDEGMSPEDADDKTTSDVRRQVRGGKPIA